jgi:hypothetical protein
MSLEKVLSVAKLPIKNASVGKELGSFKAIMENKRLEHSLNALSGTKPQANLGFPKAINDMIHNHENAKEFLKTFLTRADYSPQALLQIQYKTGFLLLHEQMFCKTAELSANTLKTFIQMQI